MIESINIQAVASYPSNAAVQIDNLKKVNFFFGFNGSGKSTISRFIQDFAKEADDRNQEFAQCTQAGFDPNGNELLAFDENFTTENFIRNNELKGVFSLNQSNAAIDQEIEEEQRKIQTLESYRENYSTRRSRLESDLRLRHNILRDLCWVERATFDSFSKINLKYPGSKSSHLGRIRSEIEGFGDAAPSISLEYLKERYDELYENDPQIIDRSISGRLYLRLRRLEEDLQKLLTQIIVGNEEVNIAALINELGSRDWVEQGVSLLDSSGSTCPFCQNETIDEELIEQFSKFFDRSYKLKKSAIQDFKEKYSKAIEGIINELNAIQELYNPNNIVSSLIIDLNQLLTTNVGIIDSKLSAPNEVKTIMSIVSFKDRLSDINKQISVNNEFYENLSVNRSKLMQHIWQYMAVNCILDVQKFDTRVRKTENLYPQFDILEQRNLEKINDSKQLIESLRNKTINTQEAVENINVILRNSGFEGFEIAEKEVINNISRYYLKRPTTTENDEVFNSLSEGEKNFVSFLYFYQLCLGTDDIQASSGKKKVIVIDDPVSSMDSQALFIVSTLIRNLIRRRGEDSRPEKQNFFNANLEQVFILTHNLYFYKEVSFNSRFICTNHWNYKVIKINGSTSITGQHQPLVSDDYSLMWGALKNLKSDLPTDSSQNILISNMMRRIIESYVKFLGMGNNSWAALIDEDPNDPNQYIKSAFVSIINDESHSIQAIDSLYYQRIIYEDPQLLFDVFASIFLSIGKDHYEYMMDEILIDNETEENGQ